MSSRRRSSLVAVHADKGQQEGSVPLIGILILLGVLAGIAAVWINEFAVDADELGETTLYRTGTTRKAGGRKLHQFLCVGATSLKDCECDKVVSDALHDYVEKHMIRDDNSEEEIKPKKGKGTKSAKAPKAPEPKKSAFDDPVPTPVKKIEKREIKEEPSKLAEDAVRTKPVAKEVKKATAAPPASPPTTKSTKPAAPAPAPKTAPAPKQASIAPTPVIAPKVTEKKTTPPAILDSEDDESDSGIEDSAEATSEEEEDTTEDESAETAESDESAEDSGEDEGSDDESTGAESAQDESGSDEEESEAEVSASDGATEEGSEEEAGSSAELSSGEAPDDTDDYDDDDDQDGDSSDEASEDASAADDDDSALSGSEDTSEDAAESDEDGSAEDATAETEEEDSEEESADGESDEGSVEESDEASEEDSDEDAAASDGDSAEDETSSDEASDGSEQSTESESDATEETDESAEGSEEKSAEEASEESDASEEEEPSGSEEEEDESESAASADASAEEESGGSDESEAGGSEEKSDEEAGSDETEDDSDESGESAEDDGQERSVSETGDESEESDASDEASESSEASAASDEASQEEDESGEDADGSSEQDASAEEEDESEEASEEDSGVEDSEEDASEDEESVEASEDDSGEASEEESGEVSEEESGDASEEEESGDASEEEESGEASDEASEGSEPEESEEASEEEPEPVVVVAKPKKGAKEPKEAPIPKVVLDGVRDRSHIAAALGFSKIGTQDDAKEEKLIQQILKDIKKSATDSIKPLERDFKFSDISQRVLGDAEIFNKPMALFLGPWSSGKSTAINYLLGTHGTRAALKTGPQPTDSFFTVLHHNEEGIVRENGIQMAGDASFSGVNKFGSAFLSHFRGVGLNHPLLKKVMIVDTPGIIDGRRFKDFPLHDVFQWFIERADAIYVMFDPSKLEIGLDMKALLDQLRGREQQTRFLLNKGDLVEASDVMRVTGQLLWNVAPLFGSSDAPIIYTVSMISRPYLPGSPVDYFQDQEEEFLRHLKEVMDERVENTIMYARRHAVRVRNHAKLVDCYLEAYYKHKGMFGNKKKVAEQIIKDPAKYNIFDTISQNKNVSKYDLLEPEDYADFFKLNPLPEFSRLKDLCGYVKGCPIDKLDRVIAYDLPQLLKKYQEKSLVYHDSEEDRDRSRAQAKVPTKSKSKVKSKSR